MESSGGGEPIYPPNKIGKYIFGILIIIAAALVTSFVAPFLTGNFNCSVDGPFKCEEIKVATAIDSASLESGVQNYMLLKSTNTGSSAIKNVEFDSTTFNVSECNLKKIDMIEIEKGTFVKVGFTCNDSIKPVTGKVALKYKTQNGKNGVAKVQFNVNRVSMNQITDKSKSKILNQIPNTNTSSGQQDPININSGKIGQTVWTWKGEATSNWSKPKQNVADTTNPILNISQPYENQIVQSPTATFSGTASDNTALERIEFYANDTVQATLFLFGLKSSWIYDVNLSSGSNNIKLILYDSSGNNVESARTILYNQIISDTTAPNISIISPSEGYESTNNVITISGTTQDLGGLSKVEIYLGSNLQGTVDITGTFAAWNLNTELSPGNNTITIKSYDLSGNSASNSIIISYNEIVADSIPPSLFVNSPVSGQISPASLITVNGNATDAGGLNRIQIFRNNTLISTTSLSGTYSTWSGNVNLIEGNNLITVRIYDSSNNSNSIVRNVLYVIADTTPPTLSISHSPVSPVLNDIVTITANAADKDGISSIKIYVDDVDVKTCAISPCKYARSNYSTGSHTYYAITFDSSLNANTAIAPLQKFNIVVQDLAAPAVSITSPINNSKLNGTVNINAAASDNIGVSGVQFIIDGANFGSEDIVSPYSISWNTSAVSNGWHIISAIARDAAGNTRQTAYVSVNISNSAFVNNPILGLRQLYVSTTGSDLNDGLSMSTPWQTLTKAANTAKAGDVVNIRAGTYHEKLNPVNSGTLGNYITFQNYNGETVIITGDSTNMDQGILISGKQYLQFKGIHVTNEWQGIYIYNGASNIIIDDIDSYNNLIGAMADGYSSPVSNITIKNSLMHNNIEHGIQFYSRVYDSTIENNKIYSNRGDYTPFTHGIEISYDYTTFSAYEHSAPTGNEDQTYLARRIKVIGNEVYDNAMQGIRTGGVVDILIKNNYAHDNGATGIQLEDITINAVVEDNHCENNANVYESETGVWVDNSKNVVVRNNYLASNKIGVFITKGERVILRNNIIVNNNRGAKHLYNAMGISGNSNSHNIAIVHNTLNNNGAAESAWSNMNICLTTMYSQANYLSSSSGFHLKNNIISKVSSPTDFGIECNDYTSDNELFYNTRPVVIKYFNSLLSLSNYKSSSGQDAHSIEQNPLLTSDYHLGADSPAIDNGAFLATTVGSGSGTIVTLTDASYFTDGFGVASGDLVKIGNKPLLKIVNVDYANNKITVDQSIQWIAGEGVSYPYNGNYPDIGAYESG